MTADVGSLLATAALATVVLTYPVGVFRRRWHRWLVTAYAVSAVVGPLASLVGSVSLLSNGAEATRRANVLAQPQLAALGILGDAVWSSSPGWLVVACVGLVLARRRLGRTERRELRPLLGALLVVTALLVVVLGSTVSGRSLPQPTFQWVFLGALTLIPAVLLAGVAARARTLSAELVASRDRLAAAEDTARRALERDLHDGVQQQLVAILASVGLARRQVRRSGATEAAATLDEVGDQVADAVAGLRELVSGIRPPVLTDSGVAAALESRLGRLPVALELQVDDVRTRRWTPEIEATAFFVVCEAVTNAVKHAPGAQVRVHLTSDGDPTAGALRLEVRDDGPGPVSGFRRGNGLTSLADRVAALGGTLSVRRGESGLGTVVRAVIPT